MSLLCVVDNDETIEFEFADLRKYHGARSICGLTVAFKVMQCGFAALADGPLQRQSIEVQTAFPGPGARDAFELVTRASTRNCYQIDKSVSPSDSIAEAANGAYYFRIAGNGEAVELGVRPDMIESDFIRLRRKQLAGDASTDELQQFRALQLKLSAKLLPMDPADVVNVLGKGKA